MCQVYRSALGQIKLTPEQPKREKQSHISAVNCSPHPGDPVTELSVAARGAIKSSSLAHGKMSWNLGVLTRERDSGTSIVVFWCSEASPGAKGTILCFTLLCRRKWNQHHLGQRAGIGGEEDRMCWASTGGPYRCHFVKSSSFIIFSIVHMRRVRLIQVKNGVLTVLQAVRSATNNQSTDPWDFET